MMHAAAHPGREALDRCSIIPYKWVKDIDMKTYRVIQRHMSEDIWIVQAKDDKEAMAMANDTEPDNTKIIPYTTKMPLVEVKELR